jgi:hypothetical protein
MRYKMMKMLLMKQRDLISVVVMDRYKCSRQLVLEIGKGLAQK